MAELTLASLHSSGAALGVGPGEGAGELVVEPAPCSLLLDLPLLLLSSFPFSWVPLLLAFVSPLYFLVFIAIYFCPAQSKYNQRCLELGIVEETLGWCEKAFLGNFLGLGTGPILP